MKMVISKNNVCKCVSCGEEFVSIVDVSQDVICGMFGCDKLRAPDDLVSDCNNPTEPDSGIVSDCNNPTENNVGYHGGELTNDEGIPSIYSGDSTADNSTN